MIPRGAIFRSLELVRLDIARGEGTLGDAVDAVLDVLVQHAEAVPMDRSTVVLKHVANRNSDCVTPVGDDGGSRGAAVDEHTDPRARAVGIASGVFDAKIVRDNDTSVGPRGVHVGEGSCVC